ncbi:MAG: YifB family Mg chelatase-like AAA ATPase [Rhodococcus sp.]|nr:YifB family Mg chelatase-like AAA ATPase [Rhodococcus sp. (in: high G+C Gram-positive bacteria)]
MALGRAYSVAVDGIDGQLVEVEADIGRGLPAVHVVGLPDKGLQEARDRIRAAAVNSGEPWPDQKVILALSPATLPKVGSVYDLALVAAVADAGGSVRRDRVHESVFLGELALDGRLRTVRGILPAALAAKRAGYKTIVVPTEALPEAGLVKDVEVLGALDLRSALAWMRGEIDLQSPDGLAVFEEPPRADLSDVVGQADARWAMEVAAAGGHHLMLVGPPGIGKTMLAHRLPGILPRLTEEEALEVTAIHSVAGTLPPDRPFIDLPPFIAPHHTATVSSLIGGGSGTAKPGAVSRAHRGVLFLDECAEMGAKALECLRTPLEDGEVRIARRDGVSRYPARFQLVLAANPCPCASAKEVDCVCSPMVRRRYLGKLSGPLLDRVDLRVQMHAVSTGAFINNGGDADVTESTTAVRARVALARASAAQRWSDYGWRTNAEVPGPALRQQFRLAADALEPIERALRRGVITARGADRALRVAWSVADLSGVDRPGPEHVITALGFRDKGFH